MKFRNLTKFALLAITALSTFNASAETSSDDDLSMLDMDIDELMEISVYSASKRPEKLSEVAAAAFVLSSEDIAKAGVNSIPEALRLVPGVQVSQTNANNWAISIRGFNRQFSNKLLVMIDGRSVYTPLFSGVFWDIQDYLLEDIERIEVIRGPGGTLWGANAVNGVINIITKEARKTKGNYASATVGTHDDILEFRHGGHDEDQNYYRVYGKFKDMSEFKDSASDRSSNDDWQQGRAGFRYDLRDWNYNPVTVSGDVYSGQRSGILQLPTATPNFADSPPSFISEAAFGEHHRGANAMVKWKTPLTDDIDGEFNSYIDYIYRDSDSIIQQERITYNFEFQASYSEDIHDVVAGIETRFINDNLDNSVNAIYTPESTNSYIYSLFLQDKLEIVEDELYVTLGAKLDYNDYTGSEFQPNIRALWQVSEDHSIWGAVSKAVRTPSRGEESATFFAIQGSPLGAAYVTGNNQIKSEELTAYEIGYRGDITKSLFLDVTAFYNDYDNLRVFEPQASTPPIPFRVENNGFGESYGIEIASVLGITENLDLKLSSTYLKQTFHLNPNSNDVSLERDEERSPEWQHSVHADYRINDKLTLSGNAMYVDELTVYETNTVVTGLAPFTTATTTTEKTIDDYVRLDLRLSYKPEENIEINLVGQNLLDSNHQEFDELSYSTASEVPRTAYIQVKYKF